MCASLSALVSDPFGMSGDRASGAGWRALLLIRDGTTVRDDAADCARSGWRRTGQGRTGQRRRGSAAGDASVHLAHLHVSPLFPIPLCVLSSHRIAADLTETEAKKEKEKQTKQTETGQRQRNSALQIPFGREHSAVAHPVPTPGCMRWRGDTCRQQYTGKDRNRRMQVRSRGTTSGRSRATRPLCRTARDGSDPCSAVVACSVRGGADEQRCNAHPLFALLCVNR